MNQRIYNPDYPIVVGLSGKACTGKTATAQQLVPHTITMTPKGVWDHLILAAPLYEMATILTKTEGIAANDRKKYAIYDVLTGLFGKSPLFGSPPFDYIIEVTNWLASWKLEDGIKPRTFMQEVGSYCRSIDIDCFVNSVERRIREISLQHEHDYEDLPLFIIVSDVRLPNEGEMIHKAPNGFLIQFEASDEVRFERMERRDGHVMTPEQMAHASEQVELIEEFVDFTMNTDNYTVADQAWAVQNLVETAFGLGDFDIATKEHNA